jgi:hypothetical protein
VDTDTAGSEAMTIEEAVPGKIVRVSTVVLASTTNLIRLKKLEDVV